MKNIFASNNCSHDCDNNMTNYYATSTTTTTTITTTTTTTTTMTTNTSLRRQRIIWCGTSSTNRPFSKILIEKNDLSFFFPLKDTIIFDKNALRFRNATKEDLDWLLTQAEEERLEYLDSIDHYDIFIVVENEGHVLTASAPTSVTTPEQYITESMRRFENWYRITRLNHRHRHRRRQSSILRILSHGLINR